MLIISDSSPITNLIRLGQLDLLQMLFGEVIIPEKVFAELANYENQEGEIEKRPWIVKMKVKDTHVVNNLSTFLDSGEAEAIALALETKADYLIIDERKGRKTAEQYGIKIVGLLGILIQAKKKGYLPELKPIITQLTEVIGFRLSKALYLKALEEVGER